MQMKSCTKKRSCVHIERRWLPTSQDERPQNETDLAGTLIMDFLASRTLMGTMSNEALLGKNKCMAELPLPPEPHRPPPPVRCGQCLCQVNKITLESRNKEKFGGFFFSHPAKLVSLCVQGWGSLDSCFLVAGRFCDVPDLIQVSAFFLRMHQPRVANDNSCHLVDTVSGVLHTLIHLAFFMISAPHSHAFIFLAILIQLVEFPSAVPAPATPTPHRPTPPSQRSVTTHVGPPTPPPLPGDPSPYTSRSQLCGVPPGSPEVLVAQTFPSVSPAPAPVAIILQVLITRPRQSLLLANLSDPLPDLTGSRYNI
ncbi:uncharacterized protein LOC116856409 [Lontra canadensis]|uniref:uncharacterized protein LOC116856409 n=1 Tax=Lontra canadensis TaxID=76717 RepID=UPI0013F35CBF|nr:uncharacterized protein LOC116856409 [Lontra canadensis]